ncbi:hypothetical protein [Leifsonia sp. RAF41]
MSTPSRPATASRRTVALAALAAGAFALLLAAAAVAAVAFGVHP